MHILKEHTAKRAETKAIEEIMTFILVFVCVCENFQSFCTGRAEKAYTVVEGYMPSLLAPVQASNADMPVSLIKLIAACLAYRPQLAHLLAK